MRPESHRAAPHTFPMPSVVPEGSSPYGLFADALADAPDLRERGVRFATGHPAHFQVMFQPELYRTDDPELHAARARAAQALRACVSGLPATGRGDDARLAEVAAWSLAHGFAALLLIGNPSDPLGDRNPEEVFRSLTGLLFTTRESS